MVSRSVPVRRDPTHACELTAYFATPGLELLAAGFREVEVFFKWYNFVDIVAVK